MENWNDEYQDDIEVLEGVFGIGDFLMPNGLVAKGCYQFLAIGCDDYWVHWAANRGGRLDFSPGSGTPPDTDWLKPGVPRDGFPTAAKEGRYSPDGSVWERTIYLHSLVVAVGRPAIRLERPTCGTFAFKGKSCQIGQNFYRLQLKTVEAVVDGKVARNMTLGLFEMNSEITRERSYIWMAPKPTLLGVFGQQSGPSIEQARAAKTLRDSFKQGLAWSSHPLPAIAAPSAKVAPEIPAQEREPPKPDIRSGLNAWKSDPPAMGAPRIAASEPSAPKSDQPPIPPDEYDDAAGGPRSLDEVIFD
jgi:hypothetical protein